MKNNFCTKCGAKLKSNQKFCTECGKKAGEKETIKKTTSNENKSSNTNSKKGLIIGIVAAVILFVGIIGTIAVKNIYSVFRNIEQTNETQEFKEDVTSFKSDLFKSFQDIESVGNQLSINLYVYAATGTNKYARYKSADEAISAALTSKSSEVAKVNSEKPGLEKRYKELEDFDTNDNEKTEDIQDALEDVYEEYINVYKAAIKPVGTPTSIMQDYKESRAAFTIKYSALNQLLKEEE